MRARLDTERMKWLALAVLMCSAMLLVSAATRQAPPVMELVYRGRGDYELDIRGAGTAIGQFAVEAQVGFIGSDQVLLSDLYRGDDDLLVVQLGETLEGMAGDGCYSVTLYVRPSGNAKPAFEDVRASIATRACVDGGVMTFPQYDGYEALAPAPPSDVRLIDQGGGSYAIEWTDNSDDEVSFAAGIILHAPESEGAYAIGELRLPDVQRNDTNVGSIGFLFAPDGPDVPQCGIGTILVYAVGGDRPSVYPGVATVPACFGAGTISFPDAGVGGRALFDLRIPLTLTVIGLALMVAGLRLCDRRGW